MSRHVGGCSDNHAWGEIGTGVGLEACPLSEWLHRHLVAAGFKAICAETRRAQRIPSTGAVKTDKNDVCGIAEIMRIGHYRPVHVKSAEAQLIQRPPPDA
jgi:transposase